MKNIIPFQDVSIGGNLVQTVNARDLHAFLESKQDFSTWIKSRIEQYGFVEDQDYVVHKNVDNPLGGRPTLDYHATIDMAKELAMVERNAKGKEARQYFIECERKLKAIDPMQMLADPAAMRGLLLTYTEKVIALESTVAEQAPKVAALDRISTAEGSMCITNTAKTLQIQPKVLFGWMQEKDWIYRRAGGAGYVAYQPRIKQGVLEHKVTTVERSDGTVKSVEQVLVTSKGLSVLAQQFSAGGA